MNIVHEIAQRPFIECGGGIPLTTELVLKSYDPSVHGDRHDRDDEAYITFHNQALCATFIWRPGFNNVQVQPEAQEPVLLAIELHPDVLRRYSQHPVRLVEYVAQNFAGAVTS